MLRDVGEGGMGMIIFLREDFYSAAQQAVKDSHYQTCGKILLPGLITSSAWTSQGNRLHHHTLSLHCLQLGLPYNVLHETSALQSSVAIFLSLHIARHLKGKSTASVQ